MKFLPTLWGAAFATEIWNADPVGFLEQAAAAAASYGDDKTFDYYVFAHSWQPSFCHNTDYPGCSNPETFWATHFTIHGLWPESDDGSHPDFCTKEPLDIDSVRSAIGEDTLEKYWPNVKVAVNTTHYDSFWDHEWSRHGTCSKLDQVTFFKSAIEKIKSQGTPDYITQHVGLSVSTWEVRAAFGAPGFAVLKCDKGHRLSQVFTCYDKDDASGVPTTLRKCSDAVLKEDTCKSTDTVQIPTFDK
ncbi:Aste57867_5828 [Aphanomyces stellatus]|uniref:Aste57867_5828 protein n=1 Tax=Aphanomyces stellatus TaxID=120398 RepID=A0A485KH87_9STRA|nr:hypothetical protein As57867_005814 [Aphanomyces stellatus]VFT82851.1 Aste57867_5828 [Aphanomyces stellatus]